MSLKDALKTPPPYNGGNRSRLDGWREALGEEDRAAFDAALVDPDWTDAALTRVVNTEGALEIGESAFRAWRKRQRAT